MTTFKITNTGDDVLVIERPRGDNSGFTHERGRRRHLCLLPNEEREFDGTVNRFVVHASAEADGEADESPAVVGG